MEQRYLLDTNAIEIRKIHRIKLPDAIIAATAIIYNMTVITRNVFDFKNIDGLTVLNLWEDYLGL